MKKIFDVLVLTLAVNFLLLIAGVGWLYQSGHLDRPKLHSIKEVVFPATQPAAATTQPAEPVGPPPPSKQLEDLLAKSVGHRTAADQLEFIRQKYDQSMAELDGRERAVQDLERQVAAGNRKLVEDRKALEAERQKLADREQQSDKLAGDKGFQETLALYNSMPARQVKTIFMSMPDDQQLADYLEAMEPRTASKVIKEFKSGPELQRMNRVLEKMRKPQQSAAASPAPATDAKE